MGRAWNAEKARRIVVALVKRKAPLFAAYKEYGLDDLEQEAVTAALRAWPDYRPRKSGESTFIYLAASRRLLDILRYLTRRAAREQTPFKLSEGKLDEQGIYEWLEEAHRTIKETFKSHGVTQRKKFAKRSSLSRVQAVCLVALRQRVGLSTREMEQLLDQRPDLLKLIGITKPPSHMLFSRVERAVTDLQFSLGGKRRPRTRGE